MSSERVGFATGRVVLALTGISLALDLAILMMSGLNDKNWTLYVRILMCQKIVCHHILRFGYWQL